ncbi:hypothetical protein [Microbacterium sp.]|uniref:hypothetical protein n=1 Tax=Microbacterium sp. TaxID=51671 RepID=UPI002FE3C4CF
MTDLNPTPNKKLVIAGVEGLGSAVAGAVAIVLGLVLHAVPLIWIGVGLMVAGGVLALATARRRSRRDR